MTQIERPRQLIKLSSTYLLNDYDVQGLQTQQWTKQLIVPASCVLMEMGRMRERQ